MPGGGRPVGRLYYEVDVEDNTGPGLASAQSRAEAAGRNMERALHVEGEIEMDMAQMRAAYAEAKAMVRDLEDEKAEIELDMETARRGHKAVKPLRKELDRVNAALDEQRDTLGKIEPRMRVWQDSLAAVKKYRQGQQGITKAYQGQEASLRRLGVQQARAIKENQKMADSVAKMRLQYAKLYTQKLRASKQDWGTTPRERLEMEATDAQLAHLRKEIERNGGAWNDLEVDMDKGGLSFRRIGNRIGGTRVHLGLFSMTLKGLSVALTAFAPVVVGVVGALSALIGTIGAGILGAAAVGGAAITGMGLAFFGLKSALSPMTKELGTAWDAMTKYEDAVRESGKGSEEAKDAMKELEATLGAMPKSSREAFKEFARLRGGFQEATGKALRKPFFETVAEGLKTASALMPIFQRETIKSGKAVSEGMQDWFKGLRSAEGKQILGDIMGNFRKSIPALMDGLGNIGTMFGRISASASRFMPSMSKGFVEWTNNLMDSLGTGDKLDQRVGRWIGHLRQFGHTAQAGGRALATFFGSGADTGKAMMKDMQQTFNGWTRWMKSIEGQKQLRDFFEDARTTMGALMPAIGTLITSLAKMSTAFAPVIEGMGAMIDVVSQAAALIPADALRIAGAFIALRKVMSIAGISGAGAGLMGLLGLGGRGGAAKAAPGLSRLAVGATAAGAAAPSLLKFATAARAVAGPVGLATTAAVLFAKATIDTTTPLEEAQSAARAAAIAGNMHANAVNAQRDANQRVAGTQQRLNQLQAAGKTNTRAYAQAVREDIRAQEAARDVKVRNIAAQMVETNKLQDLSSQYDELKTQRDAVAQAGHPWQEEQLAQMNEDLAAITDEMIVTAANAERAGRGMKAMSAETGRAFASIRRISGKKAADALQFSSGASIREIGRLQSRLGQLGGRRQALKIMADTGSAEQKILRLRNLASRLKAKAMKIDADPTSANAAIHDVKRNLDGIKDKDVKVKATDNASAVASSVNAALNSIEDETVTITTVHKTIGRAATPFGYSGGLMPSYASGGPRQGLLDNASERASRFATVSSKAGQEVRRPTFLTGELQDDKEWVITDNPTWRRSNRNYLAQAASALGMMVLPAFGGGGFVPKGGKKANRARALANQDIGRATDSASEYANVQHAIRRAENQYENVARQYNMDGIVDEAEKLDLKAKKGGIINLYQDLRKLINGTLLNAYQPVPVPAGLKKQAKKAKSKDAKKAAAGQRAQDKIDKIQSYNESLRTGKPDLAMEVGDIDDIIAGLNLDIAELDAGGTGLGGTSLGLQMASLDQARMELFQAYASNIRGAGAGVGGGPVTMPLGRSVFSGAAYTAPEAGVRASGGVASIGSSSPVSGKTVNVTNNYAAPPPDQHTWSQQLAYELEAAL